MKSLLNFIKISSLLITLCVVGFAQNPPNRENTDPRRGITREDIVKGNLEGRMRNLRNSRLGTNGRRTVVRRKRGKLLRPEFTDELKQKLEVDNTTKVTNSDILSQENTGIFKIVAFEDCRKIKKKKNRNKCNQRNVNIREFANSYSFRENKLAVFAKSDLSIRNGYLVAGRHSVQTILVDLGDVDINGLTTDSSGISFLHSFKPSSEADKMDEEHIMFMSGVVAGTYANEGIKNSHSFSKAKKIIKNHTYAMRSIAYRPDKTEPLAKDKDVLIVFRVIDKDETDGRGVTILWKQLHSQVGTFMKFN